MKCIAIDDEPVALTVIRKYCERVGDMNLQTFNDPVAGMEAVRTNHPDLLFLDIELSGHNGVELARKLPDDTLLVFTTAYSKYALDGFNLNAVDFLHKPFAYDRFVTAVEKVKGAMMMRRMKTETQQGEETITVKADYKNVSIKLADILYIAAMDNYVRIVCGNARPVVTQISMKDIAAMLPEGRFIRIHKSYIVAREHVVSYDKSKVQLHACDRQLPIGRSFQDEFLKKMSKGQ